MTEHPDPHTRWKNMRRMAYIAIAMAVIETVALLMAVHRGSVTHEVLSASAGWVGASYLLWGGIIGAYMGVSGVADGWGFKK